MPNRLKVRWNMTGLDFDRNYGINHRTGWSAIYEGSVVVQLTTPPRAAWALARAAWRRA